MLWTNGKVAIASCQVKRYFEVSIVRFANEYLYDLLILWLWFKK